MPRISSVAVYTTRMLYGISEKCMNALCSGVSFAVCLASATVDSSKAGYFPGTST